MRKLAAILAEMKTRSSLNAINKLGKQLTGALPLRPETLVCFSEALRQAGPVERPR